VNYPQLQWKLRLWAIMETMNRSDSRKRQESRQAAQGAETRIEGGTMTPPAGRRSESRLTMLLVSLFVAMCLGACSGPPSAPAPAQTKTVTVASTRQASAPASPAPTPAAASGPVGEQYFLGDVRADTPGSMDAPWVPRPDDQTVLSQGHEVCTILSTHGGDWAAIEDSPPADLRQLEEGQLHSFIDDATDDLCYEHSSGHDLGTPPSQRIHAQKAMPPPASIGQEIHGETLDFTVTRVTTAKTVRDTPETKTAKGIYVIVTMTVKNNGGTAQQLEGSSQVLRDTAGWQFSAGGKDNDNTSNVLQQGPTGVDIVDPVANLDPDQQMTVGEMFDVPEGTQPSQIVLKEMRPGNKPPLDNPYGMVVNLS
jgi:hypothetical protein